MSRGGAHLSDVPWPARRACWRKIWHPTKVAADIHMKSLLASEDVRDFVHLNSYECPEDHCGGWHVGRDRTRAHRKYAKAPDRPVRLE